MSSQLVRGLLGLTLLAVGQIASAAPCETDDFETKVTGTSQCLVMRHFGDPQPKVMLVWLHGDVSSGGPANYHFRLAEKSAQDFAAEKTLSVALVRPGYPDGDGNASSIAPPHTGRADHYTKENVGEVGAAIERLKNHYTPERMVVIGHSGGAATTAILLGMKPDVIQRAALVACPCDLALWRSSRKTPWPNSEDPAKWADKIAPETRVLALTGDRDDNTFPDIARRYVELLGTRQVAAEFRPLAGETHNSAARSPEVTRAIQDLLAR